MRWLCILLGATLPAWADRCSIPPELAGFVEKLPDDSRARRASIREALAKHPADFTLNRLFVDGAVYARAPVRERYRREWEKRPDNLDQTYLYARSLVGSDTPEALRRYAEILEKDPEYPWVHLSQLEIFRAEAFRDRKRLAASFETVRRVCPSLPEPWQYLGELEDAAAVAREAGRLREFLAATADPRNLRLYSTLWAAEFRVRPKEEHDAERRVVAEDLNRLRPFERIPEIRSAIANGARLSGDAELARQLEAGRGDPARGYREWQQGNPRPQPGDPAEKKLAWAAAQRKAAAEWLASSPAETAAHAELLRALAALEAPAGDIGRAGDKVLEADRARMDGGPLTWFLSVARAYVERGVLLDRVPAILDEAIRSFDDPESIIEIDLAPNPSFTARNRMMNVGLHVQAAVLLSEWHEKQRDAERSREVLRQAEQYLKTKAPPSGEKERMVLEEYRRARFTFWLGVAELADRQGQKLEALHAYRQAAEARVMLRERVLAAQRRLWKELGGSDEGWARWTDSMGDSSAAALPTQPPRFTTVSRTVPDFRVNDLRGGVWTLARLRGKTTIAVVWATWCAPCVDELPYVEKLAARLKGRNDVQVVTLNTDENTGAVQPFVEQRAFTFPVLLARQFAEDLMPSFAIPRTWVIRDGAVVSEQIGYGGGDKWVDEAIAQLP